VSIGPLYSTFRRSTAQLAGVLLLFRAAKTFELEAALISLDTLEANLQEALDALLAISPPRPLKKSHRDLLQAAKHISLAASLVRLGLTAKSDGFDTAEKALKPLRLGHRLLRENHDNKAGLQMVDLTCTCGMCGLRY
jgi:hypothetical protein